jgi:hypothetical protein
MDKPIKITCTSDEQLLLKRNIKACECKNLCDYKPYCTKPEDMTCGEYIVSLIEWNIREDDKKCIHTQL